MTLDVPPTLFGCHHPDTHPAQTVAWICFEMKMIKPQNSITYADIWIIDHPWYSSCTMKYFTLLQLHKYGVEGVFGLSFWWWLISGASPAWETLKSSQLRSNEVRMDPAFSSRHFIIPAPLAAKIITRLCNTWHVEANSAVSGTPSHS